MSAHAVLIVEDNPITRKMLRFAMEAEGYHVLEGEDGRSALEAATRRRPDLLVLDYVLPDMDGLRLLNEIRSQAGCADVPAIVVTGMVSRLEELRQRSGAYVQFLPKPVLPSQLLEIVRGQLAAPDRPLSGRRVLVVDDELMNRKLAAFRLKHAGYEVDTASGAGEALDMARRRRPDAILSDVMMPVVDGFAFCREARGDPDLAATPIVLVSSAYVDESDRELARRMGANALVARTPDLRAATAALEAAIGGPPPPPAAVTDDQLAALHRERLQVQLERQIVQNEMLLRQAAIQATALSIIRGLSEVLAQPTDVTQILGDVLVHCLDAGGLSTGLLYVAEPGDGRRLQAHFGIAAERKADAAGFFGHPELIRRTATTAGPLALSTRAMPRDADAQDFLARLGHASALIVPFVVLGETFGELVLASDSHDLSEGAWTSFARSLALQFGQTVALGQSLKRAAASEGRYRALMEHANDAIFILDPNGTILEANRQSETLLGRDRDEIVGQHISAFGRGSGDEAPENVQRFREALVRGGGPVDNVAFLRGDGREIAVDFSMSLNDIDGKASVLSIGRDVTERRSLEAQLLQSQKMESMGRLAGGVAHDFNNLLGIITGYSDLLRRRLATGDPRLTRYVDDIVGAAHRAAGLTRQLLAFSRNQVLQPRILDLNVAVSEAERMLRRLIGEDIEIAMSLEEHLGPVKADPGQIDQVLMNLAVNARDAMPRGGRLTIETGNVLLDQVDVRPHPGVKAGRYVMVAVGDTGYGMTEEVRARIFEPFFTTKEVGKGTGLGLATVHGIVKQSGGHLSVDSEPGRGTTFKIYLPRIDASPEALVPPLPDPATLPRGSETIVLAEDDASLRAMISECLGDAGYTVIEARDTEDALDICVRHPSRLHLLMTDVVMPGMSGPELGEHAQAARPDLRILYMSGYTDDAVFHRGVITQSLVFLQKPFTADLLVRTVREVLDR
jgi:PAS domain S-box-containing protein